MDFPLFLLLSFLTFGAVGWLIGARKGRPLAGLVWAIVLGPIGWLLMALLPSAASSKASACPHCGGVVPVGQVSCNHCGNRVLWLRGKALKPARPVA